MGKRIHKPIFIVGCGRSGTSIFYNVLCGHRDVAWVSNYSNRYYHKFSLSASSCRFYGSAFYQKLLGRRLPKPVEGYRVWDWCHPVHNSPSDPALTDKNVTRDIHDRCQRLVYDHLKFSGKKRFVNKNTRNSRRIKYLNQIFPDALFVHIVRDGRAVVASLLNFKLWWRLKQNIWFLLEQGIESSELNERDPVELATELWETEVKTIMNDKETLQGDRYYEVKYENFVRQPEETMKKVCEFSELEWSKDFENNIRTFNLKNMNFLHKTRLTPDQISQVSSLAGDFAGELGYQFDVKGMEQ